MREEVIRIYHQQAPELFIFVNIYLVWNEGRQIWTEQDGTNQIHLLHLNPPHQYKVNYTAPLVSLHIFCLAADSESSPVLLWQESKCEVIWGDLWKKKKRHRELLRFEVTVWAGTPQSHGQVGNCWQKIYSSQSDRLVLHYCPSPVISHRDLHPGFSDTFNLWL